MKISFCTAICNRLYQFSQTIDHNAKLISEDKDTEWIIFNFGSTDGLHDFMLSKLDILNSRIIYINDLSGRKWHMSAGKNSSHAFANGDILVSLDCDNYIHHDIEFIRQKFTSGIQLLKTWSGKNGDGTHGRMCITKEAFYKLGGYDERFLPAGYQDTDLYKRVIASNFKHEVHVSIEYKAIANEKTDTIKNTDMKNMTWKDMNESNLKMSLDNIKNGILTANLPNGFYVPKVEIYRGGLYY